MVWFQAPNVHLLQVMTSVYWAGGILWRRSRDSYIYIYQQKRPKNCLGHVILGVKSSRHYTHASSYFIILPDTVLEMFEIDHPPRNSGPVDLPKDDLPLSIGQRISDN